MMQPISKQDRARLNSICPYYTMYPLEFPFSHLKDAEKGDWVLDPFCGRGTTNFAARLRGLASVGIDSNPVAAATAAAKLREVRSQKILQTCRRILENTKPDKLPSGEFWERCFNKETLKGISALRRSLMENCESDERVVLRAALLGVLHGPTMKTTISYLSNQMPRTYATKPGAAVRFWKKHHLQPKRTDIEQVVARKLSLYTEMPPTTDGYVLQADSRDLGDQLVGKKFKWIVTSPPYLGMRTYYADQWLRNWFMGGPPEPDYGNMDQLGQDEPERFTADLAKVWRSVAKHSVEGAKLIVRFGALPCKNLNPTEILKQSIRDADAGWVVKTIVPAGSATDGRRQASQFGVQSSKVVEEVDLHAVLRHNENVRPGKAARTERGHQRAHQGGRGYS